MVMFAQIVMLKTIYLSTSLWQHIKLETSMFMIAHIRAMKAVNEIWGRGGRERGQLIVALLFNGQWFVYCFSCFFFSWCHW